MALRKTYQSLGGNPLSVDLQVGGSYQTIDFRGGMKFPIVRLPLFSTSEPDIQKALEAYPGYKTSYALIRTENIEEELTPELLNEQILKGTDEFTGELITLSLPSLNAARIYLRNTYNMEVSNSSTGKQLKELFDKHGVILKIETDKTQ